MSRVYMQIFLGQLFIASFNFPKRGMCVWEREKIKEGLKKPQMPFMLYSHQFFLLWPTLSPTLFHKYIQINSISRDPLPDPAAQNSHASSTGFKLIKHIISLSGR